jgi:hypothetical protein
MVCVGVDLHRKRSQVVALDPAGGVVLATDGWSWFADLLADAGIPAHMAHPLATKAISAARVKNDAVHAKTLAHLLRTNLLAEAWIAHRRPARPAGWSAPGPAWSGCARASSPNCTRCWPTRASSPS